jgi:hypothetical protein
MPALLLSFVSSGALKWVAILVLVFGIIGGAYSQHRKIVDSEVQAALQQYNINELQQALKDKDTYIKQMEDISKSKSEIVANLYIEKDKLEEKLSSIMSNIDKNTGTEHDRQSSKVLKDTFKSLGEMK